MIVDIQYEVVYNASSKHEIFSKDMRFNQFRRYEWPGYSFYTVTEYSLRVMNRIEWRHK